MRRILFAARFSAQGFVQAWSNESAFRQEVALTAILAPVAIWLGRSGTESVLLISCCLLVLIVELLNSAVEAAVDRIGDEHNHLSRRAKDMGSAAVFLSLALTVLVWATVLWERFGQAAVGVP